MHILNLSWTPVGYVIQSVQRILRYKYVDESKHLPYLHVIVQSCVAAYAPPPLCAMIPQGLTCAGQPWTTVVYIIPLASRVNPPVLYIIPLAHFLLHADQGLQVLHCTSSFLKSSSCTPQHEPSLISYTVLWGK